MTQSKVQLLFILRHDDQIRSATDLHLGYTQYNHTNSSPCLYSLPSNYMDYAYFYTNILSTFIQDLHSLSDSVPWMGTISEDIYLNHPNVSTVLDRILHEYSCQPEIQVITFGQWYTIQQEMENQRFWDRQEHCCPGLVTLFQQILLFHGESKDHVMNFTQLPIHQIQSFHRFSLVVRPILMPPFIQWLSKIWIYILTDPFIQQGIWTGCIYASTIEQESKETHTLPGHFLINDWLAAYYFSSREYRIQTIIDLYNMPMSPMALDSKANYTCSSAPNQLKDVYNISHATKNSLQL